MCKTSLTFQVSSFRSRVLVWALLAALSWSFLPSLSAAQQPTATISELNGTVLVNGQQADRGAVLNSGDVIETQAEASVELTLSDGSTVKLAEKTQLTFAELTQTVTGARISYLTLLAGRVRAFLSQEHQQAGSAFTITTPNARIDATFSEPDIEVSYNLEKLETIGMAHTVKLMAKNLATDEEVLVPVGSTVIIVGTTTKVIAGIIGTAGATDEKLTDEETIATETTAAETTAGAETTASGATAGISKGTMIAIGAGALAAAGGVAAVAGGGDGGGDDDGDGGDGDGGSGTPTYDATGTWLVTETLTAQNPNGWTGYPLGATRDQLTTITQNGNTFTTIDEDGDITQGTISGNTFTFTGTADCGDRPDITGTKTGEGTFTDQTLEGTYQVECISITGWRGVAIVTITGIKL